MTVPPQETLKPSKAGLAQSLVGFLGPVHKRFSLSTPNFSGGYGVSFLMQFHTSDYSLGASPLPLDVGYLFLVGSNIVLSMAVQQLVAILEFSQEMSTRPTLPSQITLLNQHAFYRFFFPHLLGSYSLKCRNSVSFLSYSSPLLSFIQQRMIQ